MKEATLTRALQRYEQSPHLVFWETTKACALACGHCRASAQLNALPGELTTDEGKLLIDQIAAMPGPPPILVFTGGDCLAREDLHELIRFARTRGLRLGVAPSVSPRLNRASLQALHALGVRSISISLDGSSAVSHDSLRGIDGHFDQTVAALQMMRSMGFRVQVNTTVMKRNAHELADILSVLGDVGVSIWEVFFLVGVGRGRDIQEVTAPQAEAICHFLVDAARFGVTVRTVEAPFFRRVQVEREAPLSGAPRPLDALYGVLRAGLPDERVGARRATSHTLATGDGRGVIFVGFDGEVHASGFLPVPLGNIKTQALADIYADNALLRTLRSGQLEGACGRCDYRRLCGGSRARAFAATGRVLGEDPSCVRTRSPLALMAG